MRNTKRTCTGITLIEVLVALFVLGVGLLGVISLQAQTLKLSQQSYTSTQALFLANDMAERMRVNKDVFISAFEDTLPEVVAWQQDVSNRLPGGVGSVSVADNLFTIAVQYDQQALHHEDRSTTAVASKEIFYKLTVRL